MTTRSLLARARRASRKRQSFFRDPARNRKRRGCWRRRTPRPVLARRRLRVRLRKQIHQHPAVTRPTFPSLPTTVKDIIQGIFERSEVLV